MTSTIAMLEEADNPAQYLEYAGLEVKYIDDETVEILSGETEKGDPIFLTVKIDDIPDIIGDAYNAKNPLEKVFDEYVLERRIGGECS